MLKHIAKLKKFSLMINDQEVSYILYKQAGKYLDLYETVTQKELEGNGYATRLAEKVFEDCLNQGIKLKLSCTFLQHIYNKNQSKYEHLLS
ncbi:hypothetical protein M8J76_007952 [Diaphorina citri]|nr:hypothetical protein M8J75_010327 [Diaphorina citri]KAI5716516.1 hypothetical protein M8J76_007952 [Diaphorina citri]